MHGDPAETVTVVAAGSGYPFGDVPWRATGAEALRCTPDGPAPIVIPPAPPERSATDTHVAISFGEDDETMLVKWSRTSLGDAGIGSRRYLLQLDPIERKKDVEGRCRGKSAAEVVSAELPELEDAAKPLRITCDLDTGTSDVTPEIAHYALPLTGPWWPETPVFPSENRVNPVVFDYPKTDTVSIDVTSPAGFAPKGDLPPVHADNQMGHYVLTVTATATGYHVVRTLRSCP